MIVCTECGNVAESRDGFCSSCGVLLEWSGERVEAAAGPPGRQPAARQPVARQPVTERGRPGPVLLQDQAAYTGLYCSACGVRNPEGRTFCRTCGELLRVQAVPAAPPRGWWRRLMTRLRGRRAYAAGDRPRGFLRHDVGPEHPGAVTGAAGTTAGTTAAGAGAGTGAPAHGGSGPGALAGGARPGAVPGITPPGAAQGAHNLAGVTGQHLRRFRRPRRLALSRFAPLLIVAGLLGAGLGPGRMWLTSHAFGLAHRAQARMDQRYTDVTPTRATASSSAHRHGADLAIDGINQTYWLAASRDGTGARLTVRFAGRENIDRVGVLLGEPGGDYRTHARPRSIELMTGGHRVRLSFDDAPAFQNRAVDLHGVTSITVVIRSVYPGQHGQAVALRELEFFSRVWG